MYYFSKFWDKFVFSSFFIIFPDFYKIFNNSLTSIFFLLIVILSYFFIEVMSEQGNKNW